MINLLFESSVESKLKQYLNTTTGRSLEAGRWKSLKDMAVKYSNDTSKMPTSSKNSYDRSFERWKKSLKLSDDELNQYLNDYIKTINPADKTSEDTTIKYAIITWINPYNRGNDYAWIQNNNDLSNSEFKSFAKRVYDQGPKTFKDWMASSKFAMYFSESSRDKFVKKYESLSGNTPNLD